MDVVLNSLTGDLLHASLRACAPFGRFIELGKKDFVENGKLDMYNFSDNVVFIALDVLTLFCTGVKRHQNLFHSLMEESTQMLRDGRIQAVIPRQTFDVSKISEGFRCLSNPSSMGKVALSFADSASRIKVIGPKYESQFDENKTYLLIGCFGGVGRSITRWMLSRGAWHFVFLSRSGGSASTGKALIADKEGVHGTVSVCVGDVGNLQDVQRAFGMAQLPIGGVVQASMSVKVCSMVPVLRLR